MKADLTAQLIGDFVNKHYPKGNRNRGFSIAILSAFLTEQFGSDSKYDIIKKKNDKS